MTEAHAITRARERYGLELSESDLRAVSLQIINKRDAMLIRRGHNGAQVWAVKVQGVWASVVFIPLTRKIATFLPVDAKATRKQERA